MNILKITTLELSIWNNEYNKNHFIFYYGIYIYEIYSG